jgi:hypothetical protein
VGTTTKKLIMEVRMFKKYFFTLVIAVIALFIVASVSGYSVLAGEKITICHVPPGNPENAHSITVDKSAWENGHDPHNAHSLDYVGECKQPEPTQTPVTPPPTTVPTGTPVTPPPTTVPTGTPVTPPPTTVPTNTPVNTPVKSPTAVTTVEQPCQTCPMYKEFNQIIVGSTYIVELLNINEKDTMTMTVSVTIADASGVAFTVEGQTTAEPGQIARVVLTLPCKHGYMTTIIKANPYNGEPFQIGELFQY